MPEKEERLTVKQKRILTVIIGVLLIAFTGAVCLLVGKPMVEFVSEPEKFRAWVGSKGIWGKLIFIGMAMFQTVIAVIPGEPFEIGAGYAFGAIEGTVLCIIGFTLGSLIIFALVRTLGVRVVEIFFPIEKIRSLKFLKDSKRLNAITFLIFFIPGTPKDLIAYFVGLTDIKLSAWIFIASVARIPSVVTSTFGGNALGGEKYILAAIIFAVALIISAAGVIIYKAITRHHEKN